MSKRRSLLLLALGLGLVLAALLAGCGEPALDRPLTGGPPPNVLVYMVDTLRADALATYGNDRVQTPEISRFAEEAIVYEQAFAPSSWTRASVASLFSGLQPDVHNVRGRADRASEPTAALASAFRAAGYRTGAIVTNPNVGRYFGFGDGFDEYVELFEHANDTNMVDSKAPRARADEVNRKATAWIAEAGDAPWFLFILVTDPHRPYEPPPGFDLYGVEQAEIEANFSGRSAKKRLMLERVRRKYWGEVAFTDHAFGQLVDHLRERGILEQTIVALTSDHGEHFGEKETLGHGRTLYQPVLHIPLILRLPGGRYGGRRLATPVQLVDLHPSLIASAGVGSETSSLQPDRIGDAAPLPLEERSEPRPAFAHLELDLFRAEMIYQPPWKYTRPPPEFGVYGKTRKGLFNLADDPKEGQEHHASQEAIAQALGELLDARAQRSRVLAAEVITPTAPDDADMPGPIKRALQVLGYIEPDDVIAPKRERPATSEEPAPIPARP